MYLSVQTALTIDSTAGGIALTRPAGTQKAQAQVFTAPVRYWMDGTAPTATTGHRADVNDIIELGSAEEALNFRAIRETSVSATLEITYYRA